MACGCNTTENKVKTEDSSFPERGTPASNNKFTPAMISGIKMGLPNSESGEPTNKTNILEGTRAGFETKSLAGKKKR